MPKRRTKKKQPVPIGISSSLKKHYRSHRAIPNRSGHCRVFSTALSKRGNLTDPVFAADKLIAGVRDW